MLGVDPQALYDPICSSSNIPQQNVAPQTYHNRMDPCLRLQALNNNDNVRMYTAGDAAFRMSDFKSKK